MFNNSLYFHSVFYLIFLLDLEYKVYSNESIYIYIYRKRANKKMGIKFDSKKDLRIMKFKKINKNK
jgi:hypothetical protein